MLIYKDCNCNAFWCAQVLGGNYCTLLGLQLFQFLHSAVKPIEFCSCNFQAPAFWFSTNAEYCLLPLVCFFAFLSNGSIIGSCLAWSSSLSSESSKSFFFHWCRQRNTSFCSQCSNCRPTTYSFTRDVISIGLLDN